MSRRLRATLTLLLGASCLCFRAAAGTVTVLELDVAMGKGGSGLLDAVPSRALVVPVRPEQWFEPSGRNGGTEGLIGYLTRLALHGNEPLYLSDGWGRSSGESTSDHHVSRTDSWAGDLAVRGHNHPTPQTETAARRIASALGEPDWSGGNLVKRVNGYRFQVLWRVPDHYNHVHIGVRKVS